MTAETLAVIFDLEGTISAGSNPTPKISLRLCMTDFFYPILLHELYGGHTHTSKAPSGTPTLIWELDGKHCEPILERIIPFLRIKKTQAKLALAFTRSIKARGVYSRWNPLPENILAKRLTLVRMINKLNLEGPIWTSEMINLV